MFLKQSRHKAKKCEKLGFCPTAAFGFLFLYQIATAGAQIYILVKTTTLTIELALFWGLLS
jgi:hypothetical protein